MESWLSKIKSLLDKIKILLVKFCAGLLLAVANPAEQEFKLVEQEFNLVRATFKIARQFLKLAQQAFWRQSLILRLTLAECVSDNDSERDGEDDDQRMTWRSWVNSQVLRTVHALYQEGTKRRPRRPRQRSLKSKRHLPNFAASKIDKTRKINLRHVSGRGGSMKKQGARKNDVKPDTLKKRLLDFPGQFFQVQGRQLYCGACCTNVGSCKSDASQHCKPMQHTTKVQLLFLRQFRSFVQNFCKRCCVRA